MEDWQIQLEAVLKQIPGYNPWDQAGDAWLDHDAAYHAINWFQENLCHIEGTARGQPFILKGWQAAAVGNIFGWKRRDSAGRIVRRFRKCLLFVPRGNGKTPLAAGIAVYGFDNDNEPGAQCYLAAGQAEQADYLFRNASGFIDQNPTLLAKYKLYRGSKHRSIVSIDDPLAFLKVIPAEAAGQHGGIPHISVIDELHVHESRALVDVFETGMSKKVRAQPLLVMITTSDFERESICNEVYDYACRVRDNGGDKEKPGYDPSFLPIIYELKPDQNYRDETLWKYANPNLGVSVDEEALRQLVKKVEESPAQANEVKRLHFNIRTKQSVLWLNMEKWDACNGEVNSDALLGRECFGGLDLATTIDLTALSLVFPEEDGSFKILPFFWIPERNAEARERRDRVPYSKWVEAGLVRTTAGDVCNYDKVRDDILEICQMYGVREIAYDPYNATQLALQLIGAGISMIQFRQGVVSMSEPSKALERLMIAGQLAHGGNPVLSWQASNVSVYTDNSGNIKPEKPKHGSSKRIDGIVATVMALGRATTQPEELLDVR
ncbi:MAG TPA: terminase TerL endonuclease subunit [Prosthecobacter sp.]|nr:terminase TerL endonuclease subunit [Prosthecobacter sp.]